MLVCALGSIESLSGKKSIGMGRCLVPIEEPISATGRGDPEAMFAIRDARSMALPTFEWVKNSVHTSTLGQNPEESAFFRALDRVEFESTAVKVDGDLQVLPIAEAIGVFLIV